MYLGQMWGKASVIGINDRKECFPGYDLGLSTSESREIKGYRCLFCWIIHRQTRKLHVYFIYPHKCPFAHRHSCLQANFVPMQNKCKFGIKQVPIISWLWKGEDGRFSRQRIWMRKQRRRPSSAAQGLFIIRRECLIRLIGWALTDGARRPSVPCHFLSRGDGCRDLRRSPPPAAGK